MNAPLTLDGLRETIAAITRMAYAVSDEVPAGKVVQIAETDYTHAAWIFHGEEEAHAFARQAGRTLVHLRDMPVKVPAVQMTVEYQPPDMRLWRGGH